ncbi:hypothetical protein [Paucidesulfovibrio longus]|uniref:hypothetical protein n=1 Tax=Paucidesulfovibrio longus TaxID=889 RepID=UPI0003B35674|nr:hypothetical protein [Paucidesulfovibrio longus]
MILAVDAGLRTGLALFGPDGRLRWCRSHNLGRASRLRRAAAGLLREYSPELLVVEGGGVFAEIWLDEAASLGMETMQISAEQWREVLLLPRERIDGKTAKRSADKAARKVVEWSGARRPTSLRHDAAEAVLAGFYAVLRKELVQDSPLP